MDEELARRKALTFDEAEGIVELPTQLALGNISNAVKAQLWHLVYMSLQAHESSGSYELRRPLYGVARSHWIDVLHKMADEFTSDVRVVSKQWKSYFLPDATYNQTLGFIQWFVRELSFPNFSAAVAKVLEEGRVAYRLVDGDTIVPVASNGEAEVITAALTQLSANGKVGAREHLRAASARLSEGKFADSVRESIHSVEALVRSETGESSLKGAIKKMNEQTPMHEAFKKALGNLYGYSSDQQGIRHPLLDQGDANVTERDALFMLGVCASFITYLASSKSGP